MCNLSLNKNIGRELKNNILKAELLKAIRMNSTESSELYNVLYLETSTCKISNILYKNKIDLNSISTLMNNRKKHYTLKWEVIEDDYLDDEVFLLVRWGDNK